MNKYAYVVPVALLFLGTAVPLHATVCVSSPENPTAVRGLIVGVASIGFMHLRNRIGNRGELSNK